MTSCRILQSDAEKMCRILRLLPGNVVVDKILSSESASIRGKNLGDMDLDRRKEYAAAFAFYKARYAAVVSSQILQRQIPCHG